MKLYLSIFFGVIFTLSCYAQGLQFQGNDKLIEDRTSYSVFDKEIPTFKNSFSIRFEISILQFNSFGYIFRLKDKDTNKTYNLTYTYKDDKNSFFKFNAEGTDNLISIELPNNILGNRQWQTVSVTFLLNDNNLLISINNKEYIVKNPGLPKQFHPQIFFGKSDHIVDVPVFALRNLEVENDNRLLRFPLKESDGENVHDLQGKVTGHVSNPVWLINTAYYWKRRYTYKSETVGGVNYDESKQNILFFNTDSLSLFDLRTNNVFIKKYTNKLPVDIQLGTSFVDDKEDKLYIYEVNNLPIGNTTVASLNLENTTWEPVSTTYLPMQLHHHNGYYDMENKRYIIFGGFGNQKYNKEFLSFDIEKSKWDTLTFNGDKIMPRYFSGMASFKSKNQLFIFGGMGNESGDQTIGRSYLYDLFQVDLDSKNIKKLWNLSWQRENIVPTRNMIMLNDSCFYTLCYPEHKPNSYLQLYRFSIKNGNYTILGDSIPILSEKIPTNANLYFNHKLKEFYCTVQEFQDDGSSVTRFYSLSYPSISKTDLTTYGSSQTAINKWFWLVVILLLTGLFSILIYYKKRNRKITVPASESEGISIPVKPNIEIKDKANAIYLFGEFTVYDKNGRDITYMFSARLRQAFLLILEHSLKDGISSQQFSEALWPDRSEFNVKNLRNVTLNHLRKILSDLNGIDLLFDKGYFKIELTDDCYCDCFLFEQLIHSENNINSNSQLIEVLIRGKFLKSSDDTLLDSFKEKIEAQIRSILSIDIEKAYDSQDYIHTIHLSEVLFITDPLNEKALYYLINSLYSLKQTEEAKKKYALFAIEYKKENKQDFPYTLSSILKKD